MLTGPARRGAGLLRGGTEVLRGGTEVLRAGTEVLRAGTEVLRAAGRLPVRAAGTAVRGVARPAERRTEVLGTATPEVVWERYRHTTHWPQWSPQVRWVSPHADLRPGLRGRVNGVVPFTVTAVDPAARTWSWRVGPTTLEHGVDAAAATGAGTEPRSRVWVRMTGPAVLLEAYQPLLDVALRRLARA